MKYDTHKAKAKRIAVLLPSLAGGGAERSMLHLVDSFTEQGREVDLLLFRPEGPFLDSVPKAARLIELKPGSSLRGRLLATWAAPSGIVSLLKPILLSPKTDSDLRHIASLKSYLRGTRPDVLLSAMTYTNLVAIWARKLAKVPTPVVVSERISLYHHINSKGFKKAWRWRYLLPVVSHTYGLADGVVAVSDSVCRDLVENTRLKPYAIKTIYNPVVNGSLRELAAKPLVHPWFGPDTAPVILGVGRLIPQKDFRTLLHAFAILRSKRQAHLIILGEGRLRPQLESLAQELGIGSDIELPGFTHNPFQYMSNAAVFALSSIYEGLPGALIQALACGCPVVSTDCPGGSAEILEQGKVGRLVPMQDAHALADALSMTLNAPPSKDYLKACVARFSVPHASRLYLGYLDSIVSANAEHKELGSK